MRNKTFHTRLLAGSLGLLLLGPAISVRAEAPAAPAAVAATPDTAAAKPAPRKLPGSLGLGTTPGALPASAPALASAPAGTPPGQQIIGLGSLKPKGTLVAANSVPSASTVPATAAIAPGKTLVAQATVDSAPVTASPAAAPKQPLDKKQIRKLLTAEPDPSLVLEPVAEPPPPPKPVVPKPPPRRPAQALPSNGIRLGIPGEAPASAEVAVILSEKQFIPAKVKLKAGVPSTLYFTTINDKPAAVVIEELQIQRWVAKEGEKPAPMSELERAKMEATKEVTKNKITEIMLEPHRGTFVFHDVISGAKGQIIVE